MLQRLEKIIQDAGFTVKVLDAAKVPTRHRSPWIAENAPGVDVIISHPQPVRTGLTLFDAPVTTTSLPSSSTRLATICSLCGRHRAGHGGSGRSIPAGCSYLYYRETMQARAMALMAQKLDASLALEGQFSAEGLAALSAESGSLTMELAKSLVENLDFGDAERVWEKFNMDEAVRLTATTHRKPASSCSRCRSSSPSSHARRFPECRRRPQLSLFLDSERTRRMPSIGCIRPKCHERTRLPCEHPASSGQTHFSTNQNRHENQCNVYKTASWSSLVASAAIPPACLSVSMSGTSGPKRSCLQMWAARRTALMPSSRTCKHGSPASIFRR